MYGDEIIVILPDTGSKLGRFAKSIKEKDGIDLAFSLALTGNLGAAFADGGTYLLLTSLNDIIRNDIGAATRHEFAHFFTFSQEDIGNLHLVFSAELKNSSKKMFSTYKLEGYENYISFDEIHAYSVDLFHSLWKRGHLKNEEEVKIIDEEIEMVYLQLHQIASSLKNKIKYISNKKIKNIENDAIKMLYELEDGTTLTLPIGKLDFHEHLSYLISFFENFQKGLVKAKNENKLKDFLRDFIQKERANFFEIED